MAEVDSFADELIDFIDGYYDDALEDIFGDEIEDWDKYISE